MKKLSFSPFYVSASIAARKAVTSTRRSSRRPSTTKTGPAESQDRQTGRSAHADRGQEAGDDRLLRAVVRKLEKRSADRAKLYEKYKDAGISGDWRQRVRAARRSDALFGESGPPYPVVIRIRIEGRQAEDAALRLPAIHRRQHATGVRRGTSFSNLRRSTRRATCLPKRRGSLTAN